MCGERPARRAGRWGGCRCLRMKTAQAFLHRYLVSGASVYRQFCLIESAGAPSLSSSHVHKRREIPEPLSIDQYRFRVPTQP